MTAPLPMLGIALEGSDHEIGRWLTSSERKRKRRYKRAMRKKGMSRKEARQAAREYKKHLKATAEQRDAKFIEKVEKRMSGPKKPAARPEEETDAPLDDELYEDGFDDEGADVPLMRQWGMRRPWRNRLTYPPSYRALRAPAGNGRGAWIESRRDGRVGPYQQADIVTLDEEIIIPAIQGQAEEDAVYIRGVVEQVLAGTAKGVEFAGDESDSDGSGLALATIEAVGYDWLDDIASMSGSQREFELAGAPVIQAMNVVAGEVNGMAASAEFGAIGLLSAAGGGLASLAAKFRSKRRREGKLGKRSAKRLDKLRALRDAGQLNKRQQGALTRLEARQAKRAAQAGFLVQRDNLKGQLQQNRQNAMQAGNAAAAAVRNPNAAIQPAPVAPIPGAAPVVHQPAAPMVHQPAAPMVHQPAGHRGFAAGYGAPAQIGSGNGLIVPRSGHTVTSAQVGPGVFVVAVQPSGMPTGAGFVNAVNAAARVNPSISGWGAVDVGRGLYQHRCGQAAKCKCGSNGFNHPVR